MQIDNIEAILKDYYHELDKSDISIIKNRVSDFVSKGLTEKDCFKSFIKYLDVRRTCDGYRITQTINEGYKRDMTMAIYLVKEFVPEEDRNDCYVELIDLHGRNLLYEDEHPPVVYKTKKEAKHKKVEKPKFEAPKKKKSYKQTKLFDDNPQTFNKKLYTNSSITIGI